MSCPETSSIEALLDGRVRSERVVALRSHLATCDSCSSEMKRLEGLRATLSALPEPRATSLEVAAGKQRLLDAARRRAPEPSGPPLRRVTFFAAAALAAGTAATLGLRGGAVLRPHGSEAVVRTVAPASAAPLELMVTPAAGAKWSRASTPAAEVLRLDAGALGISVERHAAGRRLVVTLPDGELEDVGTVFHVEVRAGHTREVSVSEGVVALRLRGQPERRLAAGESFHAAESADSTPAAASATALEPAATGPAASASTAPKSKAANATPSADDANACPGAPPFQDGVQAFKRGDYSAAASLLERFSAQCGRGNHGEDAAYLRMVALARAGRHGEARAQALTYLARFPTGFRRKEAEQLAKPE